LNMKKFSLISLLVLGAFVLSACTGQAPVNTWPGLAVDAQHAYLSTGSFIYAIDLQTGKEVWHYPEDGGSKYLYFATPVLTADGQLLIGSQGTETTFVSINPATGKENWAEPFMGAKGIWVAPPLVLNERIYAPNADGFVYVLGMDGKPAADRIEIGGALWSAPSTDGTLIYVVSLDHHLRVIDPVTNKVSDPVDLGGAVPGSPFVTEDGAYVGSFASNVQFVTPNGKSEAVAEATDWVWGTPALDGETLYYADLDGNVYSFDLASGRQNWTIDVVKEDKLGITAGPLVVNDQIYIATEEGKIFALDMEAKIVFEKEPGGEKANLYTTPVAADDLILVAPYKGDVLLAAYDAEGKLAWTFLPE
jgi:outer membrane protein assembly factor BamB